MGDDAESLMHRVGEWLSHQLPDRPTVEVRDVSEPAQGFSSRTIMFTAVIGEDHARALVARLQRDSAVPMLSDVFHQYRVMKTIAAHGTAKVPNIPFADDSGAVIGVPFFLMDRLEGRVPPDFPSYHVSGWFCDDLDDAGREACWMNGIREMQRLHRIDWHAFPFLADGRESAPDAGFYLDKFVGPWFEWAAQGKSFPLIEDAFAFLRANAPPARQSGLVWNDGRLGNTMYQPQGSDVVSLLDFEVATLGPPEIDLAHWLFLDEVFSEQFGHKRISGLPDQQSSIAAMERLYGGPMPYFSYYLAVAALKILVLSVRDYSNGKVMDSPDALPQFLSDRLKYYLSSCRNN